MRKQHCVPLSEGTDTKTCSSLSFEKSYSTNKSTDNCSEGDRPYCRGHAHGIENILSMRRDGLVVQLVYVNGENFNLGLKTQPFKTIRQTY